MELALSEHNKIREKHLNTISLKLTEDLTTGAKKYAEELRLVSVSFGILYTVYSLDLRYYNFYNISYQS